STAGYGIQQGDLKCSPGGNKQVLLPSRASLLYRALSIKCSYYLSDLIFDCGHNQLISEWFCQLGEFEPHLPFLVRNRHLTKRPLARVMLLIDGKHRSAR